MMQPPVHLRLVALTANLVEASDSPRTSVLPNGNVQLLLILKTGTAEKTSREKFGNLVAAELNLLPTTPNCIVNVRKLVQPVPPAKHSPSAVK